MKWNCPYCKKLFDFEKHQQKGGHITGCPSNPKHSEIYSKIAATNTISRIEVIKNCKKCAKKFSQLKTETEIKVGGNKNISEYCSRSCANSHIVSDQQKAKTSKALKGRKSTRASKIEIRTCIICGTSWECKEWSTQKSCSRLCGYKLISRALKGTGKVGGYKVKSGTSKFHGAYYKDIWMDSSWEIALATQLDTVGIIWERDSKKFFNYIDIDNNPRKYYPDFYLPDYDLYLECKGYWTEKVRHKMKDVQARNNFYLLILEDIKSIQSFNLPLL